jgi:hypothetical protein
MLRGLVNPFGLIPVCMVMIITMFYLMIIFTMTLLTVLAVFAFRYSTTATTVMNLSMAKRRLICMDGISSVFRQYVRVWRMIGSLDRLKWLVG